MIRRTKICNVSRFKQQQAPNFPVPVAPAIRSTAHVSWSSSLAVGIAAVAKRRLGLILARLAPILPPAVHVLRSLPSVRGSRWQTTKCSAIRRRAKGRHQATRCSLAVSLSPLFAQNARLQRALSSRRINWLHGVAWQRWPPNGTERGGEARTCLFLPFSVETDTHKSIQPNHGAFKWIHMDSLTSSCLQLKLGPATVARSAWT